PVVANLGVGQRMVDRSDVVINKLRVFLKECRRHSVRARFYWKAPGHEVETGGSRFRYAQIDVQQCHTVSVDRDLELFLGNPTKKLSCGSTVQERPEVVIPIGREVVDNGNPAARPERSAVHLT